MSRKGRQDSLSLSHHTTHLFLKRCFCILVSNICSVWSVYCTSELFVRSSHWLFLSWQFGGVIISQFPVAFYVGARKLLQWKRRKCFHWCHYIDLNFSMFALINFYFCSRNNIKQMGSSFNRNHRKNRVTQITLIKERAAAGPALMIFHWKNSLTLWKLHIFISC